jgi:hypothetical protein
MRGRGREEEKDEKKKEKGERGGRRGKAGGVTPDEGTSAVNPPTGSRPGEPARLPPKQPPPGEGTSGVNPPTGSRPGTERETERREERREERSHSRKSKAHSHGRGIQVRRGGDADSGSGSSRPPQVAGATSCSIRPLEGCGPSGGDEARTSPTTSASSGTEKGKGGKEK